MPESPRSRSAAFLALPTKGRNLKALYTKLVADGVDPPALSTLYDWSAEEKWRSRAQEGDGAVLSKVSEIIEHRAEERIMRRGLDVRLWL